MFDNLAQHRVGPHRPGGGGEVIHAGTDKVHIDTNFARYRKNGSLLAAFDSLYVINNEAGHWGVKIRSSYAP